MIDSLLAFLEEQRGPEAYLVLALASLIEYVFPPFPGDSVALLGVFLAATAGFGPLRVHLALTAGSLVGSLAVWGFGRWADGRRAQWPRFLRSERATRTLSRIETGFARHGGAYLALNRFLPVSRALFFVAAGLVRMPMWKVALWGTISAAAWNALLLGAGFAVGTNYEALEQLYERYTIGALVLLGVVVLALVGRWAWRRR